MAVLKGWMKWLTSLLVVALALGAGAFWWVQQPLHTQQNPLDLSIEPGTSPKAIAQAVADAGVNTSPVLLYAWFRLSGQSRLMRAGSYEIAPGTTPVRLLNMLVRGEESLRTVTIVEGWNWRQVRQALAKAEHLKPDSRTLTDAELMAQLGRPGTAPEGRFYPDTYSYSKGASDLAVLKRAAKAMDKRLMQVWEARQPGVAVKSPEEALILASIVEKETGKGSDRAMISGVFNNRHAGQGRLAGRRATCQNAGAVLCGQGRRQQPLQRQPGRTQPGGQPLPARPEELRLSLRQSGFRHFTHHDTRHIHQF